MNFIIRLIISLFVLFQLTACADNAQQRKQAQGDFSYLASDELLAWQVPEGTPFVYYSNYSFPAGEFNGEIGVNVDIRPNKNVLDIISHINIKQSTNRVTLVFKNQEALDEFWVVALKTLEQKKITLEIQTDNAMVTNRVLLDTIAGKDLNGKYQITRTSNPEGEAVNFISSITIDLIELTQENITQEINQETEQNYIIAMTNALLLHYAQINN